MPGCSPAEELAGAALKKSSCTEKWSLRGHLC